MIKKGSVIGIVFSLIIGLTSCDKGVIYEGNESFEGNIWKYDDVKVFSFTMTDSMTPCRIFFNMRTTLDYEYSNVFVNLYSFYPNGTIDTAALEFFLAEPNGKWLGDVSGTVIENSAMINRGAYLIDPGVYTFKIEQAMFNNDLGEILDVGFRVENLKIEK